MSVKNIFRCESWAFLFVFWGMLLVLLVLLVLLGGVLPPPFSRCGESTLQWGSTGRESVLRLMVLVREPFPSIDAFPSCICLT